MTHMDRQIQSLDEKPHAATSGGEQSQRPSPACISLTPVEPQNRERENRCLLRQPESLQGSERKAFRVLMAKYVAATYVCPAQEG